MIGIVLAAGDGERMGGSKALLVVEGDALARVHAGRLRQAGCTRVVVVVRPATARVLDVGPTRDTFVLSDAADQAGSLAIAVRALTGAKSDELVILTPVDAAPARAETIALLAAQANAPMNAPGTAEVLAVTPVYAGKGGHPVVCKARVLAPYAERREVYPPLRDVLAALGDARLRVEVGDPAVAVDLDTPADVEAVTGAPPRFWRA